MNEHLNASVIIPTKNRPADLQRAIRSVLDQTADPQTLIVVDQSSDEEGRHLAEAEFANATTRRGVTWKLRYIHDTGISGLTMARNRALEIADGNIWLFLDDDVVLEPDFVEQLIAVYRDRPDVGGVSGVITNYPRPSAWFRLWDALFVHGPFHDERQRIYWNADRLRNSPPIAVSRFTGCLMSFRADAIRGKRFDENLRGVSEGEDVDFCMQLGSATKLVVALGARLEHRHSPAGRLHDHWLRRSVRGNLFLYRKNWKHGLFNHLCYWWLWAGYCSVALVASLRRASLDPWRALRIGTADAMESIPRPQRARTS
jgi:GT2 family glycosyltransferase